MNVIYRYFTSMLGCMQCQIKPRDPISCSTMLLSDSVYCYIPNGSFFRIFSELVAHLLFMFIPASGRTNPSFISHQPWNDLRTLWVFPKKIGKTPPIIHLFIGFSMIFTIHFELPLFLETSPSSQKSNTFGFPKFRKILMRSFFLRNSGSLRVSFKSRICLVSTHLQRNPEDLSQVEKLGRRFLLGGDGWILGPESVSARMFELKDL